jgi:hypothetical protein
MFAHFNAQWFADHSLEGGRMALRRPQLELGVT